MNAKLLEIFQKALEQEDITSENNEKSQLDFGRSNAQKIDYLKMLLDIYSSTIEPREIGNLVKIYWEDVPIKIQQTEDQLTPFLVIQFLGILKKIVKKGLKKSYYKVQENLISRVRGKILVGQHIKQNVFKNQLTKTHCEYQVFGEDSLENRFLKKVFRFCVSYVENNNSFFENTKAQVQNMINFCRPAFEHIKEDIPDNQLRNIKNNPFFNEYKEAIQIGNFILRQFSYNIAATSEKEIETPPFWIDMPRLFELYLYQKLLDANPNDKSKIQYQFGTYGNYLDILIKNGENSIVIDAKYKLHYKDGAVHQDIRQVSGYARLKRVRKECGLQETDDNHIDCLIVYPVLDDVNCITNFSLEDITKAMKSEKAEIKAYHKVYKLGIKLPVLEML